MKINVLVDELLTKGTKVVLSVLKAVVNDLGSVVSEDGCFGKR
jgi:hypothetical protein